MPFTLQVTHACINVSGCHWNTCKLVFIGTQVCVNTAFLLFISQFKACTEKIDRLTEKIIMQPIWMAK